MIATSASIQAAIQETERLRAQCQQLAAFYVTQNDVDRAASQAQSIKTARNQLDTLTYEQVWRNLGMCFLKVRLAVYRGSTLAGIPEWMCGLCAGVLLFGFTLLVLVLTGLGNIAIIVALAVFLAIVIPCAAILPFVVPPVVARSRVERYSSEALSRKGDLAKYAEQLQLADAEYQRLRACVHCRQSYQAAKDLLEHLQSQFSEHEARLAEEKTRLASVHFRELRGVAFERFLVEVFQMLGYTVEMTKASSDYGVDLVATKGEVRLAIQAKGWEGSVGNSAVQEAYAGKAHYRCNQCAVITNSSFTRGARSLAFTTGCQLIDGNELLLLIAGQIL
ncbi:MAG: restriction endonuclease [Pirellulaceae bacterium]|nr:restriction endonuclease [Pirellulaceae bacterium]